MNLLSINIRGVRGEGKAGWIKGLKVISNVNFLAIQESKLKEAVWFNTMSLWGNTKYELEQVYSEGMSGGLLSLWDPSIFRKRGVIKERNFLAVRGVLIGSDINLNVVNVHAPNEECRRKTLCRDLINLKESFPGACIFL